MTMIRFGCDREALTKFFHVTTPEAARAIQAEGFFGGFGDVGFGVYFFGTRASAQAYAARGGWDHSLDAAVILAVGFDTSVLVEKVTPHPEWPDPENYVDVYFVAMDEDDEAARLWPAFIERTP